ncbi:Imm49 family immunity protein [Streptomyces sp. NPDC046853]|uniref:immunity 49 family protein n=1 Tax=Streptomyces sp. NPDC046853 TaxID=3154920 RepID=UPI0033C652A0
MRIQRHHIGEAAVSAVREGFCDRIGRTVHSMAKSGPVTGFEWGMVSEEFFQYLGALSVETPDLHSPEAKAVLRDAAQAAVGRVAYAAFYPVDCFQVNLNYVNFGMDYDPEETGEAASLSAYDWIDALCLAVLAGQDQWHAETFRFAREAISPDEPGAALALIHGLRAYVHGDTAEDNTAPLPSPAGKLGALDAALGRLQALEQQAGQGLLQTPQSAALRGLRALSAHDQSAFAAELTGLLTHHHHAVTDSTRPDSLLPLLPLTLTALAYRREGWPVPVETDYLPHALVTGFETSGPRVEAYGRARRPEAAAQLAAGPVRVDRPRPPTFRPDTDENIAWLEEDTTAILDPHRTEPVTAADYADAMGDQQLLFQTRAALTPDITPKQVEHLALASRLGAAAFRAAGNEAATSRERPSAWTWCTALHFALITGSREDIATLVLTDRVLLADGSANASYYQALHDYLRGEDPGPATGRALEDREKCHRWGFFPPPSILLSQLVDGDEESFSLALLDALEEHRDHYRVADRADQPGAAINLGILALACHARRRGWNIPIVSPYLPGRLLEAARPL